MKSSKYIGGFSLMETVISIGLASVVMMGIGMGFRMAMKWRTETESQKEALGSLEEVASDVATEIKSRLTSYNVDGGIQLGECQTAGCRRIDIKNNSPSGIKKIRIQTECVTVPTDSPLASVNFVFPGVNGTICPGGERPVVSKTIWPDQVNPSQFTKKFFRIDPNAEWKNKSLVGMALIVTRDVIDTEGTAIGNRVGEKIRPEFYRNGRMNYLEHTKISLVTYRWKTEGRGRGNLIVNSDVRIIPRRVRHSLMKLTSRGAQRGRRGTTNENDTAKYYDPFSPGYPGGGGGGATHSGTAGGYADYQKIARHIQKLRSRVDLMNLALNRTQGSQRRAKLLSHISKIEAKIQQLEAHGGGGAGNQGNQGGQGGQSSGGATGNTGGF